MRIIWKNGEYLPEPEAYTSVYDEGQMYGTTVFEMTRSFKGQHFKLNEHIDRLYRSANYLRISMPEKKVISEGCYLVTGQNTSEFAPDDEHRLMINVSRGALGIYEDTGAHKGTNIIITDFPLRWTVRGMGRLYDEGINAVIPSQRVPTGLECKVKHRSRLYLQMANIEVSQVSGDRNWALLLDKDGFIAEGTGANFFAVINGTLVTPKSKYILEGISRQWVIDEAKRAFMPFKEADITPYDVYNAQGAFFTGTPFCLLPVTSLNGHKIGKGYREQMTSRLLSEWSYNVGLDIEEQIKKWDKDSSPTMSSPYQFK